PIMGRTDPASNTYRPDDPSRIYVITEGAGGGQDTLDLTGVKSAFVSFDPRYVGRVDNGTADFNNLYFPKGGASIETVKLNDGLNCVIAADTPETENHTRTYAVGQGRNYFVVLSPENVGKNILVAATAGPRSYEMLLQYSVK